MLAGGKISPGDVELMQVTDDLDYVVAEVRDAAMAQGVPPKGAAGAA
jgi:hypothetical protein